MKTHQESDALKCKECGKVFSSKSNLNKHVKKHAPGYVPLKERKREKKHACSDCDKKFDTLHSLQVIISSLFLTFSNRKHAARILCQSFSTDTKK